MTSCPFAALVDSFGSSVSTLATMSFPLPEIAAERGRLLRTVHELRHLFLHVANAQQCIVDLADARVDCAGQASRVPRSPLAVC